jgi:ectoine hydroxylase-related dioxygenase (phytanoyl-CoA dioxygenase family)
MAGSTATQVPPLTTDQVAAFERDGYIVVRGLLREDEIALLANAARKDAALFASRYSVEDDSGRKTLMAEWNHAGDDIYGMVSRSRRIVAAMEQLLDGEVYHYHSKMMLKEPRVGGAWEWHQDYGYWYQNGCLLPDMASCMIALDRATEENGCLKVLRGSHRMGRIEHGRVGKQTGADLERVAVAQQRFELVACVLDPGDALFFHANLLHASGPNESERPRWSLICAYNTARNDPYKDSHHPRYTPLSVVDDEAIRRVGGRTDSHAREFLDPKDDKTIGH